MAISPKNSTSAKKSPGPYLVRSIMAEIVNKPDIKNIKNNKILLINKKIANTRCICITKEL